MLNEVSYSLNVARIRRDLTNAVPVANGAAPPNRTRAGYGNYTIDDPNVPVTLYYHLQDLYIEGWGTSRGEIFMTSNAGHPTAPDVRLPYTNQYGALGLDRNTSFTITVGKVNNALKALYNATIATAPNDLKEPLSIACVAFAEAVRFDDVLVAIVNGTPIDDLDWDKHKRPDKVRVVKGP